VDPGRFVASLTADDGRRTISGISCVLWQSTPGGSGVVASSPYTVVASEAEKIVISDVQRPEFQFDFALRDCRPEDEGAATETVMKTDRDRIEQTWSKLMRKISACLSFLESLCAEDLDQDQLTVQQCCLAVRQLYSCVTSVPASTLLRDQSFLSVAALVRAVDNSLHDIARLQSLSEKFANPPPRFGSFGLIDESQGASDMHSPDSRRRRRPRSESRISTDSSGGSAGDDTDEESFSQERSTRDSRARQLLQNSATDMDVA
jgi:hypothetical protein